MKQTIWIYEGSDVSLFWEDSVPTVKPKRIGGGLCVNLEHGAYDSSKLVQVLIRWPRGLEPVVNVYYDKCDHFVDVVTPPAEAEQEPAA